MPQEKQKPDTRSNRHLSPQQAQEYITYLENRVTELTDAGLLFMRRVLPAGKFKQILDDTHEY